MTKTDVNTRGMSREPGFGALLGVVAATVAVMGGISLFHQAPPTLHPATVSGHIVVYRTPADKKVPSTSTVAMLPVETGSYRIGDGPDSHVVTLKADTAARYEVRTRDGRTVSCLLRNSDASWQHSDSTRQLPCLDVQNGWDGPSLDVSVKPA